MTKELVSVIIPTYNRDKFIGDAIQSILNQTYKNFEILIVDDGSQDRTKEIVNSFNDKRIRYFYQDKTGRSAARNLGIKYSIGQYITFLDSDDLYLPNKIELQVNFFEKHPEVYMIYTSAYCIDEDSNPITHTYLAKDSGYIYDKIAYFIPTTIILPTVMLRSVVIQKVKGFDESMDRFEDTDIWRRISKIYYIHAMQDFTCLIRTHGDNILHNQDPKIIIQSIDYYLNKIITEDIYPVKNFRRKIITSIKGIRGIRRLCDYYGKPFFTVPSFRKYIPLLYYKCYTNIVKIILNLSPLKNIRISKNLDLTPKNLTINKKKILFVAVQNSIHAARWINQISTEDYEIYMAAIYQAEPHHLLKKEVTVYYHYNIAGFYTHSINKPLIKFVNNDDIPTEILNKRFSKLYKFWHTDASIQEEFGPNNLLKIIDIVKPDLIHSLEFQTCSYNVLAAKLLAQSKNLAFPEWWATNWGSDIYYYQHNIEHNKVIRNLLSNIDYYSSECNRDVQLAKKLGYNGKIFPVIPNVGGIDIDYAYSLRNVVLPSDRKMIMVKGYHYTIGRALTALSAIEKCHTYLHDYHIIVYSVTTNDVREKIYQIRQELGLHITILPYKEDHEVLLKLFSESRIYLSVSLSDGISISLLEAMAMGTFPIQTNTSCCEEWINDGVSGFVIPPDDVDFIALRLKQAVQDDKLINKAFEINWQVVQDRFNGEKCKQQVAEMYRSIFDKDIKY